MAILDFEGDSGSDAGSDDGHASKYARTLETDEDVAKQLLGL